MGIPLSIAYGYASVTQEVEVVNSLIHDIIVGQDCPLFLELWKEVQNGLSGQPRELETLGLSGPNSEASGPKIRSTNLPNVEVHTDGMTL